MLLFKKKDLLIVISKSGDNVQFTKPLKDILKYQHRYNYKFKLYENGKVTVADDYIIDGETLTVLFRSSTVTYTSEGATYTEGSGGSGGGSGSVSLYGYMFHALDDNTALDTIMAGQTYVLGFNMNIVNVFDFNTQQFDTITITTEKATELANSPYSLGQLQLFPGLALSGFRIVTGKMFVSVINVTDSDIILTDEIARQIGISIISTYNAIEGSGGDAL